MFNCDNSYIHLGTNKVKYQAVHLQTFYVENQTNISDLEIFVLPFMVFLGEVGDTFQKRWSQEECCDVILTSMRHAVLTVTQQFGINPKPFLFELKF